MKKSIMSTVFVAALFLLIPAQRAEAQSVWGLSGVGYNQDSREVFGVSATWLDYELAWYYDPEVLGELYWQFNDEVPLDSGYGIGLSLPQYGLLIPAVVNLHSNRYLPLTLYTTYSTHFVRSYYYYSFCSGFSSGCYADPFGFSNYFGGFFGSNSGFPGFGFNPFLRVAGRRYTLGTTHISILTPVGFFCLPSSSPGEQLVMMDGATAPPCPTPSPTPTPTPVNFTTTIEPHGLRPAGTTGQTHTATVTVQTIPAVANKAVALTINLSQDSGGHVAALHTGPRPTGRLKETHGSTDASGRFRTTYDAPFFGTSVNITAKIDGLSVGDTIEVKVPDLQELAAGTNYELRGANAAHPSNHWGTAGANTGLVQIADDYKAQYHPNEAMPDAERLRYNDQSLSLGGKFDLGPAPNGPPNWNIDHRRHDQHREGNNCDIRVSDVPANRQATLLQFFFNRGIANIPSLYNEVVSLNHWHVTFGQQVAVARNAGNFVDEIWWGVLEREAREAEWKDRLTTLESAQSQGQTQSVDAAKAIVAALFNSVEYLNRSRTDQEFVTDLYAGFLQREPDEGGYNFWLSILQNENSQGLPGRAHLIVAFEECSEFADLINALEGSLPPQPTCNPAEEQACYNNGGTWDPGLCSCTYEPDPCIHKPWLCDQY